MWKNPKPGHPGWNSPPRLLSGQYAPNTPPFTDYKMAVEYAKYQGKATTIPKSELGKLSPAELEWYKKWRQRYSSYERRYHKYVTERASFNPRGDIAGSRG
jgi:hypothetical protein